MGEKRGFVSSTRRGLPGIDGARAVVVNIRPVELKQDGSPVQIGEGAKRIAFSFEKEETRMRPVDDSNAGSPDLAGKPLEIEAHREGDSMTIALSGEMDLSTVGKLDAAIRNAEDTVIGQIVVGHDRSLFRGFHWAQRSPEGSRAEQRERQPAQLHSFEA